MEIWLWSEFLYNNKFTLTSRQLGTNSIVIKRVDCNMPHVDASWRNLEVSHLLAYSPYETFLMLNSTEHEISTALKTKMLTRKDFFLISNSNMLYLSYS